MNNRNQYPPPDNALIYLVVIIVLAAGGYYAWSNGMFTKVKNITPGVKKDTRSVRSVRSVPDVKNDTPGVKKDTRSVPDVPGVCALDCSSIPGSSCVNGKCTDPYLQLHDF